MSLRRLLTVLVAAVVATAGLTLAPAPARADTSTTYLCDAEGLTHPITVVVDSTLGVVVDGTPLQSTVDPLTATLDTVINDLVGVVDGLLSDLLGPLAALLEPVFAILSPSGDAAEGLVESLVCTVDGAAAAITVPLTDLISDFLAGVVPGTGTTGGGTAGGTSGGATGGTSGSTGSTGHPAYNLCTLAIAAKAGARSTRLTLRPAKKRFSAKRHGVVTIEASYQKGATSKKAKGEVLLCDGTAYLGYVTLKKGASTVKLPKLAVGRHRLLARYAGSAQARPRDKRITLTVTR